MKFPVLVAGAVIAVLATGAVAQNDPAPTAMPNANQTPVAPADGIMPNANGTLPDGGTIAPNGTASGVPPTPVIPPPVPDCMPGATTACTPNPNCQAAPVPPPAGSNCLPPVLPTGR